MIGMPCFGAELSKKNHERRRQKKHPKFMIIHQLSFVVNSTSNRTILDCSNLNFEHAPIFANS